MMWVLLIGLGGSVFVGATVYPDEDSCKKALVDLTKEVTVPAMCKQMPKEPPPPQ